MPSNPTAWSAGYSAGPSHRPRRGASLAALVRAIGRERVTHPVDAEGPPRSRLEILARVLWTRATIDADLTAIKLLVECLLAGEPAEGLPRVELTADDFAAAQALVEAALAPATAVAEEVNDGC